VNITKPRRLKEGGYYEMSAFFIAARIAQKSVLSSKTAQAQV